jgi:hypothetical protein
MEWLNNVSAIAAVISAMCSVIAAGVSVAVFIKAKRGDFTKKIEKGDADARRHADQHARRIDRELVEQGDRIGSMENTLARIEQQQQHNLVGKDLSPLHEKINGVALQVAAVTAEIRGTREQLVVIQRFLMGKTS